MAMQDAAQGWWGRVSQGKRATCCLQGSSPHVRSRTALGDDEAQSHVIRQGEADMAEFHQIRRTQTLKQIFVALVLALGVVNVILTAVTLAQL